MLCRLLIKNIAVIESCEVVLDGGLNVMTGETGAGKSLVIDSINLILGKRGSREIIRNNAESCEVQALFFDGKDETLISRQLFADGRNVCKVNGDLKTVKELKEIGENLIVIHGQQDNAEIASSRKHVSFIDEHGKIDLMQYKKLYSEFKTLKHELSELEMNEQEKNQRLDLLNFQIEEIEEADLKIGEEEELIKTQEKLDNAEKLAQMASGIEEAFSGDEWSVVSALSKSAKMAETIAEIDESMEETAENILSILEQAKEVSRDISRFGMNIVFDPQKLEEIGERLDTIYKLKKKYGFDVAEVLKFYEDAVLERDELLNVEIKKDEKSKKLLKVQEEMQAEAEIISKLRKKTAEKMQKEVMQSLAELDMEKTKFEIDFKECDPREDGIDECEFLISTNPIEPPKPLSKIASGGEMSRIMLSLKSVIAENNPVQTYIFDEIDTGVSGRAAKKIAKKMAALASQRQIICVTHLPQIAAIANHHYLIEKEVLGEGFATKITEVKGEEREKAVASMISGENLGEGALLIAKELLEGK